MFRLFVILCLIPMLLTPTLGVVAQDTGEPCAYDYMLDNNLEYDMEYLSRCNFIIVMIPNLSDDTPLWDTGFVFWSIGASATADPNDNFFSEIDGDVVLSLNAKCNKPYCVVDTTMQWFGLIIDGQLYNGELANGRSISSAYREGEDIQLLYVFDTDGWEGNTLIFANRYAMRSYILVFALTVRSSGL